jgi:hypothetical protein
VTSGTLAAWIAIAAAYWGPAPCDSVSVVTAEPPQRGLLAWTYTGACEIYLTPGYRRGDPSPLECQLIVHEYGHLHGHDHDHPDPVMSGDGLELHVDGCRLPQLKGHLFEAQRITRELTARAACRGRARATVSCRPGARPASRRGRRRAGER